MSAALRHRFGPFDDNLSAGLSHSNMDTIRSPVQGKAASAFRSLPSSQGMSSAHFPAESNLSAPLETEDQSFEIHVCPQCQKEFSRLCDLNKHAKSHSRPFKCSRQDCKYWSLGWPTAKELERHVNDKHLAAPETFPCRFPPCPYKSKRDSNRKQHMEKIHGWTYVRSKSNGRRLSRPEGTQSSPLNPSSASTVQKPSFVQQDDFLLYDEVPGHPAMLSYDSDAVDDEMMDVDEPNSQDSDVVVPWTSPETRLQRRKTDLQNFTQRFHHTSTAADGPPIDPQLSAFNLYATQPQPMDGDKGSKAPGIANHAARRLGYSPSSELGITTAVSTAVRSSAGATYSPSFRQRTGAPAAVQQRGGRSYGGFAFPQMPQATNQQARPRLLPPVKRKEDDDEDDEHPQKKLKTCPASDFKDSQMPDIFHAAYPDIYNRDKKPAYSSCHTQHQDISTLVRHLSRAPHRLTAEERYITSFDVQPQDGEHYVHTRVGVCRRCWQVYESREQLDRHISVLCERVSKGKREKWHVLFNAFTPYLDEVMSTVHDDATQAGREAIPRSHARGRPSIGTAFGRMSVDSDDGPHDAPSPTTIELGPPEEREAESPRLSENERLRRDNQQLTAALRCVLGGVLSLGQSPALSQDSNAGRSSDSSDAQKFRRLHGLAIRVNDSLNQRPRVLPEDTRQPLLGLGLQQTELPRGMMDEINSQQDDINSQQPLSRSSSGLSSDGATLRHVPNSPPQQFEDFAGASGGTEHVHPVNPAEDPRTVRHRPSSRLDSGYVSGNRSSLTEAEAERMKTDYPLDDGAGPRGHMADRLAASHTMPEYPYNDLGHTPVAQPPNAALPSAAMSPGPYGGQEEGYQDHGYTMSLELLDQWGLFSQPSCSGE